MKINTKKITQIIKGYKNKKSGLLAALQDVQEELNWLPPEALKMISKELCIPLIDVYSVASFYRAFSLVPRGKHMFTVCLGTACHVRGAQGILDRFEEKLGIPPGFTTKDGKFTLESVACLGACALAPIVVVDGKYHGKSTVKKADGMINEIKEKKSAKEKSTNKKKTK